MTYYKDHLFLVFAPTALLSFIYQQCTAFGKENLTVLPLHVFSSIKFQFQSWQDLQEQQNKMAFF